MFVFDQSLLPIRLHENTQRMKSSRIYLVLLVILVAGLLSSCSSGQLAATSWPGVTVKDDVAYVAYLSSVYAVRSSDSTLIWSFPEKPDNRKMFFAAPALIDGQVIVGDYTNVLHGLDAANGTEKWAFSGATGRWIASPLVVDNKILAPNGDHTLYALDMNGNLVWKFKTKQALWSRPVSDGKLVYQASLDHKLYAIDLASGSEAWSVDLVGAVIYSPTLTEDGKIYVSTLARNVIAIDAASGKILWQKQFDKELWSQPVFSDGRLYFGDLEGTVFALSAEDGSSIWQQSVGEPIMGQPTIIPEGVVFATEVGNLVALDPNGTKLWTVPSGGKLYTGPVLSGERLYTGVTQGDNILMTLSTSGQIIWSFKLPK